MVSIVGTSSIYNGEWSFDECRPNIDFFKGGLSSGSPCVQWFSRMLLVKFLIRYKMAVQLLLFKCNQNKKIMSNSEIYIGS